MENGTLIQTSRRCDRAADSAPLTTYTPSTADKSSPCRHSNQCVSVPWSYHTTPRMAQQFPHRECTKFLELCGRDPTLEVWYKALENKIKKLLISKKFKKTIKILQQSLSRRFLLLLSISGLKNVKLCA